MLCQKMATRGDGFQFPCGQCQNCRINFRRAWQARLLLEAASHEYSAFVTLTFRDVGTPSILRRSDLKLFYRGLRRYIPDLRHFSAGEYGTRTGRAHYHAHIFSVSKPILQCHIAESWPFGSVHVGDTEPESLDYVLGYLLKNKKVHVWPIEERYPEFRAFSPGISKRSLPHLLIDGNELPREFRVFGRSWPIPRYLRDRAQRMGFTVSDRKEVILERFEAQQMRALLMGKTLSSEEELELYENFRKRRIEIAAQRQKKAIRDAYREVHGHTKKVKHETF